MFNAPSIYVSIEDIAKIYEINDTQCTALETAVKSVDNNLFLDLMGENAVSTWEEVFKILPTAGETLDVRRTRVKDKILERLPYSYRIVEKRIQAICSSSYIFEVDVNHQEIKLHLSIADEDKEELIENMFERILPLNLFYTILLIYTKYEAYNGTYQHSAMHTYTHQELRNGIEEGDL